MTFKPASDKGFQYFFNCIFQFIVELHKNFDYNVYINHKGVVYI